MMDNSMLAAMREAIAELLPDTCNILSVTRTADGMGGWTDAWGTASRTVSCRLDTIARYLYGEEMNKGAAVRSYEQYILSLPYDTTITTENRVEHKGVTYAVVGINDNQSWMAVKRATVELI